uniref:Uncharacterized protein n=1 Tax=Arundo donax TaxID=35708 RepID=A0A0A9CYC7_ARUDO
MVEQYVVAEALGEADGAEEDDTLPNTPELHVGVPALPHLPECGLGGNLADVHRAIPLYHQFLPHHGKILTLPPKQIPRIPTSFAHKSLSFPPKLPSYPSFTQIL